MNKEVFIEFVKRVKETDSAFKSLEGVFGGIMTESSLGAIYNFADRAAFAILGFKDTHFDIYDSFAMDFWSLIDTGKAEIVMIDGEEEKTIILDDVEAFYEFYTLQKEIMNCAD